MNSDAMIAAFFEKYQKQEKARKAENYRQINEILPKGQIVFTGSSLMEHFPIEELYHAEMKERPDGLTQVYNRGIASSTTDEFIQWIGPMAIDLEPSKLFMNIGTNDLNIRDDGKNWSDVLELNYSHILQKLKLELPETQIYLMAYYPVNEEILKNTPTNAHMKFRNRTNELIEKANAIVESLTKQYNVKYIDVNDGLKDKKGQLKAEYTVEGLHLYSNAYRVIYDNLKAYL